MGRVAKRAAFTIGAEAADAIEVAIQFSDDESDPLTGVTAVEVYLSSDADGEVPIDAAGVPDMIPSDGGPGAILSTPQANVQLGWRLLTDSAGAVEVVLTNAGDGADTVYLNAVLPNGKVVTSGAITFADDTP